MKRLLLICVSVFAFACGGEDPQDVFEELQEVEQRIASGEITDFDQAITQLEAIQTKCTEFIAKNEYSSDSDDKATAASFASLNEKIQGKINEIGNERVAYQNLSYGNEFERLKAYANYLNSYPKGIKRDEIEGQYTQQASRFLEDANREFSSQLTALEGGSTEPINSLFHMAKFTGSFGSPEENQQEEYIDHGDMSFEKAFEIYNRKKSNLDVILASNVEITTANGVSPRSLRQQMEQYENNLHAQRKKQEELFREMISQAIVGQGYGDQAEFEIKAYIARDRGGFFSTCDASSLVNDINQAENYKINIYSDRVEATLHYNVNSTCYNNAKVKYYDAQFLLVFPVINRQLGDGYFKNRTITRTA